MTENTFFIFNTLIYDIKGKFSFIRTPYLRIKGNVREIKGIKHLRVL